MSSRNRICKCFFLRVDALASYKEGLAATPKMRGNAKTPKRKACGLLSTQFRTLISFNCYI